MTGLSYRRRSSPRSMPVGWVIRRSLSGPPSRGPRWMHGPCPSMYQGGREGRLRQKRKPQVLLSLPLGDVMTTERKIAKYLSDPGFPTIAWAFSRCLRQNSVPHRWPAALLARTQPFGVCSVLRCAKIENVSSSCPFKFIAEFGKGSRWFRCVRRQFCCRKEGAGVGVRSFGRHALPTGMSDATGACVCRGAPPPQLIL